MVDGLGWMGVRLAASAVVGSSLMLAQAVAEDPVTTWIGVGGQAVAWTVVGYFARALLSGQMVVRSHADEKAKWEAAQQRWEKASGEILEALAESHKALTESHKREGQLYDLVAELRRTPRASGG